MTNSSYITTESGGRQNIFPTEPRPYVDQSVSYDGYPQNAEKVNGRWAMIGLVALFGGLCNYRPNNSRYFIMSPLSGFLVVIVFFTAILVAYLTKQFQNENLNYLISNPMTNSNPKVETIEKKKKVVAETLNGRFAMLGLIAAVGACT